MTSPARRQCKATNRKGDPCAAAPMKDSDYCSAHNTALPDETRFGSPAQTAVAGKLGGAATRKPTITEMHRQLVAENALPILRPYYRILGFDVVADRGELKLVAVPEGGAKLHGTEQRTGAIIVSEHDDLGAHLTAAERLTDRIDGKPKQAVEHTGEDGQPIQITAWDLSRLDPEDLRAMRELAAKATVTE